MRSYSRILDRLRALASFGLAPELIVPEMAILIGRTLETATYPAVFVTDRSRAAQPENFTVWLGADQTVRELRQLLKLGIWPGPKDTPSLQTIMANRSNRQVFAATLWGEGCVDEGPWGDMWRARRVQQGLQAVYFPPSGRVAVAVMARATGAPPFSPADLAFGEAAVPFMEAAIDSASSGGDPYDEAVPTAQLILETGGAPAQMSFGTAEMLRDMGGGGPDAVEAMTAELARLAASLDAGPAYGVAADPFVHIRREVSHPGPAPRPKPLRRIAMGRNAFGDFSVMFSPLAGANAGGRLVTLERRVPRALIALRGALQAGASARELQLIVALVRGETLEGASGHLGISLSSTKTMLERIVRRADADSRSAALAHFIANGRAWSW